MGTNERGVDPDAETYGGPNATLDEVRRIDFVAAGAVALGLFLLGAALCRVLVALW